MVFKPSVSYFHSSGAVLTFSENLQVGDTFYWEVVTHRDYDKEVLLFLYREGDSIKGVINGDLNKDIANIDRLDNTTLYSLK